MPVKKVSKFASQQLHGAVTTSARRGDNFGAVETAARREENCGAMTILSGGKMRVSGCKCRGAGHERRIDKEGILEETKGHGRSTEGAVE